MEKQTRKHEAKIRAYILNGTFTWAVDIVEHTIWGFKNAPYKNLNKAMTRAGRTIQDLLSEGLIVETVETAGPNTYSPRREMRTYQIS